MHEPNIKVLTQTRSMELKLGNWENYNGQRKTQGLYTPLSNEGIGNRRETQLGLI